MASKNYDFKKIKKIVEVLLKNPDGLWLRKLSRESGVPLSTVHYYLDSILGNVVENVGARDEEGKFFGVRIIRLKKGVFRKLSNGDSGKNLIKLLKTTQILSDSD